MNHNEKPSFSVITRKRGWRRRAGMSKPPLLGDFALLAVLRQVWVDDHDRFIRREGEVHDSLAPNVRALNFDVGCKDEEPWCTPLAQGTRHLPEDRHKYLDRDDLGFCLRDRDALHQINSLWVFS